VSELIEEQVDVDELELPSQLPVLPLKDTVVFPDSVLPLAIGQERSIKLVDAAVDGNRLVALVASKDAELDQPGWDDMYEVGTAAVVHKLIDKVLGLLARVGVRLAQSLQIGRQRVELDLPHAALG